MSGYFGPVQDAPIDELADLRDAGALDEKARCSDDDWYDDADVINPPADASWLSARNRPIPIARALSVEGELPVNGRT